MKVYVNANDMGKTVTYKEENGKRQHLYVHDNEGFIFKSLEDYTKQVRKEVIDEIKKIGSISEYHEYENGEFKYGDQYVIKDYELDQLQGEDKWRMFKILQKKS
jgi:hypothetical protein